MVSNVSTPVPIYGIDARDLKEVNGREGKDGVPSDTPNEQVYQISSDPSAATKGGLEGQRKSEGGDQGTGTEYEWPPETPVEHTLEAEHTDGGAREPMRSEGSRGTGEHSCRWWYSCLC